MAPGPLSQILPRRRRQASKYAAQTYRLSSGNIDARSPVPNSDLWRPAGRACQSSRWLDRWPHPGAVL